MKVTALVVWPVNVEIEVSEFDNTSEDLIRERLFDIAREQWEGSIIQPIIQDCSNQNLID